MLKKAAAGLLAAFTGLSAASTALASPAEVIIIRHGEKPETGNGLDQRGLDRALALVDFFKTSPSVTQHGAPAAIYAMRPGDEDGSLRPIQTVTPLANALSLPVNADYTKNQLADLAADVMRNPKCDGKTVLICWEHKVIPEMVREFGLDSAPTKWSGDVFDRAWILNFTGGKAVSIRDVPEHVLPGDSAE